MVLRGHGYDGRWSEPPVEIGEKASATVRLLPPKGAARGTRLSLKFGAFWGATVEYWYEVVGP